MSLTYKKGEIIWAKIQGYSWWPGRITRIKLKLNIKKNRLGKLTLQYEKEPLFYITFFPNDSRCKVRLKNIKKFIDKYKLRSSETKKKKLKQAIDLATKAFLKENPDLSFEAKQKIFNIKLYATKKFRKFKEYLSLVEEDEEQNGENDIQSFIESEANEIEIYKKELKDKKNKNNGYLGKKRKISYEEEIKNNKINRRNVLTMSEEEDEDDSYDSRSENEKLKDKYKKFNKELKKCSDELFQINVEIKRKNNINNIINILDNIENIINKSNIEFDFNVTKDLLIILNSYTHYSNETIMGKSLSLHKEIISKFLYDIFSYEDEINQITNNNTPENSDIISDTEKIYEEISTAIDKLKNAKEKKSLTSTKDKNKILNDNLNNDDLKDLDIIILKKEIENQENNDTNNIIENHKNNDINSEEETINNNNKESKENKENEVINANDDTINFNNNEPYLKDILNTPNYFSKKKEGQLYPDNFFKDIYLKSNISSRTELLRKKMCLQLYNILKLVLPYCQEDIFKKNIIFLEYLARKNDPLFGNKYMTIINMIYNKIKLEAVKIKNKNKK